MAESLERLPSVSSHTLSSEDIREVYHMCEEISHEWKLLGTHLGLSTSTINILEENNRKKSCDESLRKLLEAWLNRDSPSQPLPSWKTLSQAVQEVDLSLTLSIADQHSCGCCVCTNSPPSDGSPVALLSSHYESIYSQLSSLVDSVSEYLYREDIITTDQLETIVKSTDNKRETLFTILESVIARKGSTLVVFATALLNDANTLAIGKKLLQQHCNRFMHCYTAEKSSSDTELVVSTQYQSEFTDIQLKLGELCCKAVVLLEENLVKLSAVKMMLGMAFPELKVPLCIDTCNSVEAVISDVVRPQISVFQFSYLEAIFKYFNLNKDPLVLYQKEVDQFLQTMQLKHSYGQLLMDEFHSHTSKPESITFVLDWDKEEHCLKDLKDLFKKLVRMYSDHIQVKVIFPMNFIEVQCVVPSHLQSLIVKMILEEQHILKKEGVMSIRAGGVAVFTSTMEKQSESQRIKARINQRMEELNKSLCRRDKRIKALSDNNYKLKSANQLLEDLRTQTRAELDHAHALINRLQQANTTLLENLGRKVPTKRVTSPSYLSRQHRSRSLLPAWQHNKSHDRTRSLKPQMRTPPTKQKVLLIKQWTLPIGGQTPPPSYKLALLNPSSPAGKKIPIATYYIQPTLQPHPQTTSTSDHTQKLPAIEHSPRYSPSPVSQPSPLKCSLQKRSPLKQIPSLIFRSPSHRVKWKIVSEISFDPDYGSEFFIKSLKDARELSEFEKEELKIWKDEQKMEFNKLKVKYNILKERYDSLFKRAKGLSKKIQLAHKEKLKMDREVARLYSRADNEFDVKREDSLREKLHDVSERVKKVKDELLEQIEENKVLYTTIATSNKERDQMDSQLNKL